IAFCTDTALSTSVWMTERRGATRLGQGHQWDVATASRRLVESRMTGLVMGVSGDTCRGPRLRATT
ncbi:hypothetical protein KUCAC02_033763, partial [Chaenocephalus aceratus]